MLPFQGSDPGSNPGWGIQIIYNLFVLYTFMDVIKYSGGIEPFNPQKVRYTLIEAGGSKKLAGEAVEEVKKNYHENMKTGEILNLLLKFLKKEPGVSERYDLKRAIMSLGPSGFPFETFFANVLNHYEYKTKVGEKLIGDNIVYEIDIIAQKIHGKKFMVECKYHNKLGIMTKIRHAEKAYRTFLKLQEYKFYQPWLSTNTKCSQDTIKYAGKVNLRITSWAYPKNESLRILIENQKLYPITILKSLPSKIKEKLYNSKILIAKDLLGYDSKELIKKTGLTKEEFAETIQKVKEVMEDGSKRL